MFFWVPRANIKKNKDKNHFKMATVEYLWGFDKSRSWHLRPSAGMNMDHNPPKSVGAHRRLLDLQLASPRLGIGELKFSCFVHPCHADDSILKIHIAKFRCKRTKSIFYTNKIIFYTSVSRIQYFRPA